MAPPVFPSPMDGVLFESIFAPLLIHSLDGRILDANPAAVGLYGRSRDELASMHMSRISLSRPAILQERFQRIVEDGERIFDAHHRNALGSILEVEVRARTVDFHGCTAILTIVSDRTDERRATQDLRRNEEMLRTMIENAPVALSIRDAVAGRIDYTNPKFRELFGYGLEDIGDASNWWNLAYPDPAERKRILDVVRANASTLEADGRCQELEARVSCKDGTLRDIVFHPVALGDRTLTFCVDLTHHRDAQRSLERMATAVEQSGDSIVITDADATIQHVNHAFETLTGYTREEVVGGNPRILQSGRHGREFYRNLWDTLRRGEVWRGELVNRRKDGSLFEEAATIAPIRDAHGVVTGYVAVKRNVTEENRLRRELQVARRMEALGTLAGGIAHDFNNVLGAILAYADLAADRLPPDSESRPLLEKLKGASHRARDLVSQILSFSRQGPRSREAVSIPATMLEVVDSLQTSSLAMVRIDCQMDLEEAHVLAEPSQLHQVLMNLGTNAIHALGEGGGTIRFGLVRDPEDPAFALVSVHDDGCGISPDHLDRIFDPFFTTKPPGEGTGIGLAVVVRMVQDMGGRVGVESHPGSGATFTIRLPLVATTRDDLLPSPPPPPQEIAGIVGKRILFVDDEPTIRDAFHQILVASGLEVTSTWDSGQALRLLEESPKAFDLLVTDLSMPGIDGLELAERASRFAPDLPILLCTGYMDREIESRLRQAPSVRGYLVKPFEKEDFLRRISIAIREEGRP